MKTDNIIIISIPILAGIILLSISAADIDVFQSQETVAKAQAATDENQDQENQSSEESEIEAAYQNYENIHQKAVSKFKAKIEDQWGEFSTSTNTEWVSYKDNGNVRRMVDYETGNISVELLEQYPVPDRQYIKRKMEKEVYQLLNATEEDAFKADEVAQTVEKELPSNFRLVQRGFPSKKRLFSFDDLVSVTFNYTGYVKVSNKSKSFVTNDEREGKIAGTHIIRSSFTLNKSVLQKAKRYASAVKKSSRNQRIPKALIYAIMEAESSFNPMAKSHIPAYGLMQIVPRSAGKDATKHLYGKAKILAPSYLYSTDNNIKVGAAYLHVLYYKYLSKVKNPQSRIYCAIAAYNTGASNVAMAFIDRKHFSKAVKKINTMTPDEVYEALVNHLPYKETRNYVAKVSGKMHKYL